MNYLPEPRGQARQIPMGQAPLYEPRGQARQIPMGQYLPEPRGQARRYPLGADLAVELEAGPVKAEFGKRQEEPKDEKIMGLSKPVFYGLAAVVVAGGLYFALKG